MGRLLCLVLLLGGLRAAEGIALPAEVRWAVRLDWTAARQAPALGSWLAQQLAGPEVQPKLLALTLVTGFDVERHLRRIWLAGASTRRDEVALALEGEFDRERLVIIVRGAKQYRVAEHRGTAVHTWFDDGEQRLSHAAFIRPDLLAMSAGEAPIRLLIDAAADGGGAAEFPAWFAASQGAVLAACVVDLPSIEGVHPTAAMLRNARGLRLRLDEVAGDAAAAAAISLRASLDAADEASATRLVDLVKGLQAAVQLGLDGEANPVALELARTGRIVRQERTVELETSCPVTVLAERIRVEAEQKKAAAQGG